MGRHQSDPLECNFSILERNKYGGMEIPGGSVGGLEEEGRERRGNGGDYLGGITTITQGDLTSHMKLE